MVDRRSFLGSEKGIFEEFEASIETFEARFEPKRLRPDPVQTIPDGPPTQPGSPVCARILSLCALLPPFITISKFLCYPVCLDFCALFKLASYAAFLYVIPSIEICLAHFLILMVFAFDLCSHDAKQCETVPFKTGHSFTATFNMVLVWQTV
ncbi:hypothetical protein COLO4_05300 [Corchorus olitorius]|uniref:Uncharacterized protein n=1 Tax=Corchorus olitorius TaxID=93759 RepID=A0A1R3KRC4_9ROSI|nr:hypothetical protein COLO4_05300 [Corchorus olitorius]